MTEHETQTIRNILERLRAPNLGCAMSSKRDEAVATIARSAGLEAASRGYIETWIIGSLECLLPGPDHDPKLAAELSFHGHLHAQNLARNKPAG